MFRFEEKLLSFPASTGTKGNKAVRHLLW